MQRTEENLYSIAEQKFRCETQWTGKIVQVYLFLSDKNKFSLRNFGENECVATHFFFFMSEKFHACYAAKKWLLFMVKTKYGELFNLSHLCFMSSHLILEKINIKFLKINVKFPEEINIDDCWNWQIHALLIFLYPWHLCQGVYSF